MFMRPLYETFFVSLGCNYFVCFQARMYQFEKCSKSYNREAHSYSVKPNYSKFKIITIMCSCVNCFRLDHGRPNIQ